MTNRLENEANLWREKGYGRVADLIEQARNLAHAQNVPQVFVETDQVEPKLENIFKGLYLANNPSVYTLTSELIEHFNKTVGGKLPDETRLYDISIWESDLANARRIYPDVSKINPNIIGRYNQFVRPAGKEFVNLGSLRTANMEQICRLRNVGGLGANFLYNAFKPLPQAEQG